MKDEEVKMNEISLGKRMELGIKCENWKEGDIESWDIRQTPGNKKYDIRMQQLELMQQYGMKPHHRMLDIGCGYGRGGVLFIKYLDNMSYCAFDKEPWLLKCFMGGIQREDLSYKNPDIRLINNFEMDEFNTYFDFILAQSVFSHITKDLIDKCVSKVSAWLKQDGKFLATFFNGEYSIGNKHINRKEEFGRVNTNIELYKDICDKHGCDVSFEGDFGHISGQQLIIITKKTEWV